MLSKIRVDVCCLQEVRYRNQGGPTVRSSEGKCKIWYSGSLEDQRNNQMGIKIVMNAELVKNVIEGNQVIRYADILIR